MVDLLVAITAQIEVSKAFLVVKGLDGCLADNFHGVSEVFEAHSPAAGAKPNRSGIRHVVGYDEGQLAVSFFFTVEVTRAALGGRLAVVALTLSVTLNQTLQSQI